MKMTTKLSVSSAILAAVLSGCSQQQVIGGSQVGGSQQQVKAAAPVVVLPPVAKRAPVRVYQKQATAPKPRMTHSVKRTGTGLPPAKPGQCFAKVKVPEKYVTKSKRVLIQKASSQRVLVRAPQYRWINKKVLARKASYRTRTIPAQYRNTTQRVLVKPAYNTWQKGHGAITRIDNMTGQIMCRVTVPAVYKNVTKRVLVRKAQNVRTFVPAVYKTVKQKQRVSGALYKTVNRPARYKTQNYRVKVASARYVWRPILCVTNAPKNYGKSVLRSQSSYKKQYKRPSSGISNQEYMRVMNTMKEMSAQKKAEKTAPTQGITHQQYMQVMNAPIKSMPSVTKKAAAKKVTRPVSIKAPETMPAPAPEAKPAKSEVKPATTPEVTPAAIPEVTPAATPEVTPATTPEVTPEATPPPTAGTTQKPSKTAIKQNIVYGIQAALKSKGFDPGSLDGKMGPNTAAALKAFQSSRGLPVGVLSKDTFRALGLVR